MRWLSLWFYATAAIVLGAMIFELAPILVPMLAVTVGLGVLVAGIVRAARALERRRGPPTE